MLNDYKEFLNPKMIYLPLTDNNAKLASVKVKAGDKVKIGTLLAEKYFGKVKFPVLSTVSGTVKGFEERVNRFGNLVNHVAIENDGKDVKEETAVPLKEIEGEKIKERLISLNIRHTDLEPIYTGLVYEEVKEVYVVAIYPNEPFIKTEYRFLKDHAEQIVKGCLYIGKACQVEKVNLLVSKDINPLTLTALEEVNASIENVVNIVKINTSNPSYVFNTVKKMSKVDLEVGKFKGIVVVGCSTASAVNEAVTNGIPVISKTVTLTGSAINGDVCFVTRLGTPISELVAEAGGYNTDKVAITIGKIINGQALDSDSCVITASVNTVNLEKVEEEVDTICDKCGLCNDVCPVGILPQSFIQTLDLKDDNRIRELGILKCIECGKCSFVCPHKVDVLEITRRCKRRVQ